MRVWLFLAPVCALAWWVTLRALSSPMDAMDPGVTMALSPAAFVTMWALMMTAMMLPSVAPVAAAWLRGIERNATPGGRAARSALFVSGYLAAWAATGLLAYLLCRALDGVLAGAPGRAPWIAAALLAIAGAWQLSPIKNTCLRHCRSPFASLARYAAWSGSLLDFRVGSHHGLFCVGCCAGLMVILAVTGLMHLGAMLALTAVVFLEKVWRHGVVLGRVAGLLLLAAACAAPWFPVLYPGLR